MKKELIKTQDYLLVVDDSEIKVGDWVIETRNGLNELHFTNSRYVINKHIQKKVIAHLPLNDSPILEGVPLLPPFEVEDDVEKLAEDLFDKGSDNLLHPQYQMRTFFNIGYSKAREKYKFTELDIQKAFTHCAKYTAECVSSGLKFDFLGRLEMYLESLSQPKIPTHIEFETESMSLDEIREHGKGFLHGPTFKIKTTTNSQGQQVACGKYVY